MSYKLMSKVPGDRSENSTNTNLENNQMKTIGNAYY